MKIKLLYETHFAWMPHTLFQTKILQRLQDISKDFKALNSLVTKVDKAGGAELKMQQTLTKFEDQRDGFAIKIANLVSQVIAKCHL